MDIFSILTLIGGLALFLFGMNTMGDGLVKVSGGKLERILEKLTSKRIKAVLLGAAVTAVIQSSSATTVMVVGFVNSGIMKLTQAVGVIMGANIGTTITSWLLSLTGIEGGNIFVSMLKPSSFSPVLAVIGIIMTMTAKGNTRKKDIGTILLGFAVLMFGMETMSGAVKPLAQNERFTSILTAFSNPVLGVIAGAVLTAVIQSSSASIGILQALCATGAVPFSAAIPIIMGQNIGTCVTALISSVGASKNARRASMIHLYFNLIGTIVFMVIFYLSNSAIHFSFMDRSVNAAGIAVVHSLFNLACCIAWFPFANLLVKLATVTIPEKRENGPEQEPDEFAVLDERFLEKPSFAMEICRDTAIKMAEVSRDALYLSLDILQEHSEQKAERIVEMEQKVDHYEDALGTYLVKLSSRDLSQDDSRQLSILLHCISDFERISDHAVNIMDSAVEIHDKSLRITDGGMKEISVFSHAVHDIVEETVQIFRDNDLVRAKYVEPLEEVIDGLSIEMKQRHINRLRKGKCTMEAGLILEDIITNFERVSDHCSNVAVCLIQVNEDGFDTHEYLDVIAEENNVWFREECTRLRAKYALPDKKDKIEKTEASKEDMELPYLKALADSEEKEGKVKEK